MSRACVSSYLCLNKNRLSNTLITILFALFVSPKWLQCEVPQPALAVGHATRTLRLGLPILRSIQGRSYSSFGLPASSADASTSKLELVLLSVHRQTSAFRRHKRFPTDLPWNYSTVANQPGQVSYLSSALYFVYLLV